MTFLRRTSQRAASTLLLLSLLAVFACTSRSQQQPVRKAIAELGKGRIIRLTDRILEAGSSDTVRFEHLHSGEIAVMQLWLANHTEHPLVLSDYRRSCGCTKLEFDNRPIRTDEAQPMSLTFDSRGEWGWQLKTIDLLFVGTNRPFRLFIEAEIE